MLQARHEGWNQTFVDVLAARALRYSPLREQFLCLSGFSAAQLGSIAVTQKRKNRSFPIQRRSYSCQSLIQGLHTCVYPAWSDVGPIRPAGERCAVSLFALHMRTCRARTLKKQMASSARPSWEYGEDGDQLVCRCHDSVTPRGAGTMGFNEQGLPMHCPLGSIALGQPKGGRDLLGDAS